MNDKYQANHYWLNKQSSELLTHFIIEKANARVDEQWLDEVIEFIQGFPEPLLIAQRLDNFWHPLCFHAQAQEDNKLLLAFIEFLKDYQQTHQTLKLGDIILRYQSEISTSK